MQIILWFSKSASFKVVQVFVHIRYLNPCLLYHYTTAVYTIKKKKCIKKYNNVFLFLQPLENLEASTGPVTSKLDLAERRRRDRRLKLNGGMPPDDKPVNHLPPSLLPNGNGLLAATASTVSSESELEWDSDGAECGGNGIRHPILSLVITKGPPAKLDASPQKLSFLQTFGLTTLATKNGEDNLTKV